MANGAKRVGVLSLQGDFAKHYRTLERAGALPFLVRTVEELDSAEALVIPGGESTTIGKLLVELALMDRLKERIAEGLAVFGTCAGLILLARGILGSDQPRIGALDVTVSRNAYGRQVHSFEADIPTRLPGLPSVRGVFIRAPKISAIGKGVETLAEFENESVLVRSGRILASTFHPELTEETGIHRYFLELADA